MLCMDSLEYMLRSTLGQIQRNQNRVHFRSNSQMHLTYVCRIFTNLCKNNISYWCKNSTKISKRYKCGWNLHTGGIYTQVYTNYEY